MKTVTAEKPLPESREVRVGLGMAFQGQPGRFHRVSNIEWVGEVRESGPFITRGAFQAPDGLWHLPVW